MLGMVVLTPSKTGLKAEITGFPLSGKLISSTGGSVRDGSHEAIFRIYPVEQGGIAQWTEVHEGVNRLLTVNGFYTVELGLLNKFNLAQIAEREYLGIAVDGQPEFMPRMLIDPTALQALKQ
jgi:hypothetical protein